jgi:hypothetical protein
MIDYRSNKNTISSFLPLQSSGKPVLPAGEICNHLPCHLIHVKPSQLRRNSKQLEVSARTATCKKKKG